MERTQDIAANATSPWSGRFVKMRGTTENARSWSSVSASIDSTAPESRLFSNWFVAIVQSGSHVLQELFCFRASHQPRFDCKLTSLRVFHGPPPHASLLLLQKIGQISQTQTATVVLWKISPLLMSDAFTESKNSNLQKDVRNVPVKSSEMFRSNLDDSGQFYLSGGFLYLKGSEGIVHHMKVIVDISYDEINGFLMAIQFVLFGSILLTLCCGISHIKKVFQGSWSLCDIFDVLLITASHFLSLFTVRMSKIFVSCATDQNYDLLIAAAFGSTVISFGNAMLLFFQLNKTPTVSRADHRLKFNIL
ncbi:hypothetical protein T4E_326 [Trichinella pseudospiralis]|uniref:Uncharacterized protein n=1 Tax=Trichinella pseudospiralis TaxID=6337 RepID=A0A0V0YAV4_TRIPS|nr:hypothetical protein T4E_326 [Trichinella pseudospiralis]